MILDRNLVFDGGLALAFVPITASRPSTDVIDLRTANEISWGEKIQVTVLSNGLFAAAGAATLAIDFQGSVDNSTWTTYASELPMPIATLNSRVVGGQPYVMAMSVPPRQPGAARPRFLRLNYTVATGPFTAGAVLAFLNLGRDEIEAYPRNFSVTF
jgi:hypothetical protein